MKRVNGEFNGITRRFECAQGVTVIDATDLYSDWKDWVQSGAGVAFLPMFEAIGGQSLPGGLFAGRTFFLINGWKIQPQFADHQLTILGNLYTDDASPVAVSVPGFTVQILLSTSAQAQGISTTGSTVDPSQIASSVWSHTARSLTTAFSTLTLTDIEGSVVLAKKTDIDQLESFIAPKIHALWTGNGFDPANPISAMAPTPGVPGWIRSHDHSYLQIHRQNPDGSFTLEVA